MQWFKKWWLFLLVVFLIGPAFAFGFFALTQAGKEFREVCTKQGGIPVHDGRQNQCIRKLSQ
jgi:hypothetical protein